MRYDILVRRQDRESNELETRASVTNLVWTVVLVCVVIVVSVLDFGPHVRECTPGPHGFCVMSDGSYRLSPENHTRYIQGKQVQVH